MSGFVFHPSAISDLEEIWEFIAEDSTEAADRVIEEIRQAIRSLVPFPDSGHVRSDLTSRPMRFRAVRDYLIAYATDEKPLVVIGVLHGRRSPRVIAAASGETVSFRGTPPTSQLNGRGGRAWARWRI